MNNILLHMNFITCLNYCLGYFILFILWFIVLFTITGNPIISLIITICIMLFNIFLLKSLINMYSY